MKPKSRKEKTEVPARSGRAGMYIRIGEIMIFEEKTIETERIYEGKILNLRRDKVTVEHGTSYREIIAVSYTHLDMYKRQSVSRPGSTFNNWNTEAGGGGTSYQPGSSTTITSDLTLFAQWT